MHETEKNNGFDVVAVVMERGYTNVAMDAARKAGARGGTVISARGIAENEVKRFFGIEIQAEKEIVFLVVRSDEKQQVMTALEGSEADLGHVTAQTRLQEDLGLNSITMLMLMIGIEDEFSIRFPTERLPELHTVGDVVAVIEELLHAPA